MIRGDLPEGVQIPRRGYLHDLLEAEEDRPRAPVLRYTGGEDWTVEQLAGSARACAAALRGEGIGAGDRVALMSRGDPRMIAWWFGIYMAGAVEVDVNADLRGPVLRNIIEEVEPRLIIAQPEGRMAIEALGDGTVPIIDLAEAFPPDRLSSFPIVEHRAADLAAIMHTSGTTGPSKGVMLSHGYFSNHGAVFAGIYELGPGDVFFHLLAPYHVDAHIIIAACLQKGAVFAFPERFSASRFWDQLSTSGATMFLAVGAQLDAVAKHPRPDPSMRITAHCALSAPITASTYQYYEEELGIQLIECYGQTEGDFTVHSPLDRRRRGAVGIACGAFDIAIHDPDGRDLPVGQSGEIVYRPNYPDMVTMGYWRQVEATVEASRGLWWHSGDRGHLDEDGYLYFDGRLKDSLRYRGENVSAWELEWIVRGAPGVADVAAIGVRDELGGEDEIKLFLVVADGCEFKADEIFAYCHENLARFAVPRFLEPIDAAEVIRSPGTGVIQKHRLPTAHGPRMVDRLAPQQQPSNA